MRNPAAPRGFAGENGQNILAEIKNAKSSASQTDCGRKGATYSGGYGDPRRV